MPNATIGLKCAKSGAEVFLVDFDRGMGVDLESTVSYMQLYTHFYDQRVHWGCYSSYWMTALSGSFKHGCEIRRLTTVWLVGPKTKGPLERGMCY